MKIGEAQLWEVMLDGGYLPMVHYPGRADIPWPALAVSCEHTVTITFAKARTGVPCPICVAARNIKGHTGMEAGTELVVTLNPRAAAVLVAAADSLAHDPTRLTFLTPDRSLYRQPGHAGIVQAARQRPKDFKSLVTRRNAVTRIIGTKPGVPTGLINMNPTAANVAVLTGAAAILTSGSMVILATDGDHLTYQAAA